MIDDPAAMSPAQRRSEIAAILARGVLRLRQCGQTAAHAAAEKPSESGGDCLEHGADSRPHGLAG